MTTKMTIAKATNFYKKTYGTFNLCVFSFNKSTHTRELAYGNYNCVEALCAMSKGAAEGNIVLLTNKAGWEFMDKFEEENHRRVKYEEMLPYAVRLYDNGTMVNQNFEFV